jgi:hypothetical protein
MTDSQLEAAMLSGAVAALRRRADRQAKIAGDGTGEAAIADRLAAALDQVADEFEGDARALAEGSAPTSSRSC